MSYKKLHEHILQEHDLYLLGDDMQEIIRIVLEINDNKLDVIDYYPLFEHIDKYYGVTLLDSQMQEIIDIVLEMHNEKPEKCTIKTAMQEHIEWLKEELQRCYDESRSGSYINVFREKILLSSIEHAESLLEKEKKQLEKAWQDGVSNWDSETEFEHYYNETYGEQ